MHPMRPIQGRMTRNYKHPDWGPLVQLAPDHVDEFMWMFEVELENGVALHAYKHRETRHYLHLDSAGRAFVYIWNEGLAAEVIHAMELRDRYRLDHEEAKRWQGER
jgi:hypothetical protein